VNRGGLYAKHSNPKAVGVLGSDRLELHHQWLLAGPRDIKQVVDQAEQVLGLPLHVGQRVRGAGLQRTEVAIAEHLQAVKDGLWPATVGQDTFTEEYWGLQMLVAAYRGKVIPDAVYPRPMIITKDNVDKYLK
jgi:ABC-type sugar transport system substrate-binding protein